MPKSKQNFNKKFQLLCSQESYEEIHIQSSSESSEYENVPNCDKSINFIQQNRKRKRKKKVPKNISHLDFTTVDVANDRDSFQTEKREATSPILCSQYHSTYKHTVTHCSPIICPKTLNLSSKSPILVLKTASPTYSAKVKKKLFSNIENVDKINVKSKSVALNGDGKSKSSDLNLRSYSMCVEKQKLDGVDLDKSIYFSSINQETCIKENNYPKKLDDSLESLKSTKDWNLVNKVKTYFDSHFSSENATQITIQDSLTPKSSKNSSKTSDDIEIVNSITQINSNRNSTESIKEDITLPNKLKKIRYRKDGMAYRLNMMLKKHNANISLWQHERFLAANSNFVIPKEEHLVFIIRNVEINYGCFILTTRNIENEGFLILINSGCVNNCDVSNDVILKVYEPYKILNFNDDFKLIINVCKFECEKLNDL